MFDVPSVTSRRSYDIHIAKMPLVATGLAAWVMSWLVVPMLPA